MKRFRITAAARDGGKRRFTRQAQSEAALREALRAEGLLPVEVKEVKTSTRRWFAKISSLEQETGLRQIASLLKSGVGLVLALETLQENASRRAKQVWDRVRDAVLEGGRFRDALKDSGGGFDNLTLCLTAVGEEAGELDAALHRAADQLSARRELRLKVANALAYPLLAVCMALGVAAFLVVSVIPKISEFLVTGGAQLPAMTQTLLDVSDWLRANGAAVGIACAAALAAWICAGRFAAGREAEDVLLLKIPVTGNILRLSSAALFARSMQMMLASGVTLLDALEAAAGLVGNRRMAKRITAAHSRILAGKALAESLADAKEFPLLLRKMAAVGERTGNLADAFGESAHYHEDALKRAVQRFSMLIEPVMILVTGLIVGFVYVAFFMALFSLAAVE
ncbi:MAG: type II secretion system F family protein [Kiritimatiellae bacterium]|nr:type II secretion system F family protein [Kiritimatiellia bacterium]